MASVNSQILHIESQFEAERSLVQSWSVGKRGRGCDPTGSIFSELLPGQHSLFYAD